MAPVLHHRQYLSLIHRLTKDFTLAVADRQTFIAASKIDWLLRERTKLMTAVNRVRTEFDLPNVSPERFDRANNLAMGHYDYLPKLALYCCDHIRTDLTDKTTI